MGRCSAYGWFVILLVGSLALVGCTQPAPSAPAEVGTLEFRANGEDFVRQGFVSKDGWAISFDRVVVTLGDLTAYQSDPPYDPDTSDAGVVLADAPAVVLAGPVTVDLAAGDETADPVLVGSVSAPVGRYNALSWRMMPAGEGNPAGAVLVLDGTATKGGETVDFVLSLDDEITYMCGDFVGDARKGMVVADGTADVEATFHFDHLFGDAEAPADAYINTAALGFDPLAALASDGSLEIDQTELWAQFESEDYALLQAILLGMGHTGEGHCVAQPVAQNQPGE